MWWHDIKEIKKTLNNLYNDVLVIKADVNYLHDKINRIKNLVDDDEVELKNFFKLDAIYQKINEKEKKKPKKKGNFSKKVTNL